MRILLSSFASLLLAVAACGPAPKPQPIVPEGPMPETCCCKSVPMASTDGLPVYESGANRMECSSKQGTCVDEVQCQGKGDEPGAVPPPPSDTPAEPADPTSAPIQ